MGDVGQENIACDAVREQERVSDLAQRHHVYAKFMAGRSKFLTTPHMSWA